VRGVFWGGGGRNRFGVGGEGEEEREEGALCLSVASELT